MFKVQLENFRCFYEPTSLEVRPITFLVGENSAGKTTFMAAVRILLESFSRNPQNPFNRDPYYLGGYDQIAHFRGGVKGRAKSFSLELTVPASTKDSPAAPRRQTTTTRHKLTFVRGSPQPELIRYEFATPDTSVILDLSSKVTLKLISSGEEKMTFAPQRLPPTEMLRKDLSYLRFVFDEISFSLSRNDAANPAGGGLAGMVQNLLGRYTESVRFVTRRTFASSPIRTEPLRTYTPSEITPSSEGAHVPVEMARQKISSPSEWETVHSKLMQFGKDSGLFEDIDIRLLGKKDGDPFQIVVRTKGPPFNLMDVGYGVSQALPIIYQLEQTRQHDTYLLQQPEVHLHPRAQAELGSLVARLAKQRQTALYVLETHSDYIIDRVRMEVAAGRLDHRSVTIIFFDKKEHEVEPINMYISEKGDILHPPPNFRAFFLEEHSRLLGL